MISSSSFGHFHRNALMMFSAGALFCFAHPAKAAPNSPEGLTLPLSKAPVQIAKDGKAAFPIVISPDRIKVSGTIKDADPVKKTAEDLASFLKRMTGAEFAIEESKEAKGITLGTLADFPDPALKEPLAIKDTYNGIEAFSIRTDENGIRLIANTNLGVSHAAYRFLELMGCRWYFPTATWEIIPKTPSLSFQLNEDTRPTIWSRDIWLGRIGEKWDPGDHVPLEVYNAWKVRNRMASSLQIKASHAWHGVAEKFQGKYKKDFEQHPEYYALVDGNRPPKSQLCVTNPGLQKLLIDYAITFFETTPGADMMPFDPADGPGWCECPDCKKLGHQSNQAFYLANVVAKGIQEKFPTKYIGLLAYSWHSDPPDFSLEPNVYVQLTSGFNSSKKTFEELFELWSKKCPHLGIYEYFSYWLGDFALWPGFAKATNLDAIVPRIKWYAEHNVNSLSDESASAFGLTGLGYYIANKGMWDDSVNTDAIKSDFYEKAFGPAKAPMIRYYERLNQASFPVAGAGLILANMADLEEASKLAKGNPEVLARLKDLREHLVFNYLGFKTKFLDKQPGEKEMMLSWMTWGYRTRLNWMSSWSSMRASQGKEGMEKFGEESWYMRKSKDNPWRVPTPVTDQELTTWFQKIRDDFGKLPVYEKIAYAKKMSLADFGGKNGSSVEMRFVPQATVLLASIKGEPFKLDINIGKVNAETRDGKYTLVASDGTLVEKGDLPEGDHKVNLKVPGPGIYAFTCRRGAVGWSIKIPNDVSNGFLLSQENPVRPAGSYELYFYVPKGTKEIALYTVPKSSPVVRRPDGGVAYEGVSNGNVVAIPVGSQSGKVWSISGRIIDPWFYNVPGVLSTNPDRVFVPEDVAKKDGLKLVF